MIVYQLNEFSVVSAAYDGDGGHAERLPVRRASTVGGQPGE